MEIRYLETTVRKWRLKYFPAWMSYKTSKNEPVFYIKYADKNKCLMTEFENEFQDLKSLENNFALLFTSFLSIDVEKVLICM